ncbi:MAG: MazG nucleotide pyrophosphohydrolase domain-containing protein, partial [Christensenellaceae bacterium]
EALSGWEKNKTLEKQQTTYAKAVLDVPKCFPALLRAHKVGKRAGRSGMDFDSVDSAVASLLDEIDEFVAAVKEGNGEHVQEELGDLLLSAVNAGRKAGGDAEEALRASTEKFIRRFVKTEELVLAEGKRMEELSAEEMDAYYRRAKELCK